MTCRILIVDDNRESRTKIEEALRQRNPSVQFDVADSGMMAAVQLKKSEYDIVISDQDMKAGTGFWLYHFMRQYYPDIPLLILAVDPEAFRGEIDSTLKAIVHKNDTTRLISEVEKVRH